MNKIKSIYETPLSANWKPIIDEDGTCSEQPVRSWPVALSKAIEYEKKGESVSWDIQWQLHEAANTWTLCACGNLCDAIPRTAVDAPKDSELYRLGIEFSNTMPDPDNPEPGAYQKALEIHNKIEQRATEILQDMGILEIKEIKNEN